MVSAARTRGGRSTLSLLRTARFFLALLDALLLLAIVGATEVHRAALQTVGKETAPTIIAAQHVEAALADMDADAADDLLEPEKTASSALQAFETRRVEAAQALLGTAEHITFGDAERMPIQSLQVGLGSYARLVQRARDLHERGDPGAVAAYREAAGVMDTVLVPAADAVDRGNSELLERAYAAETFRASVTRALIVLLAFITLAVFAAAQMMLSQRVHRTFNPLLFMATLVVSALALFAVHAESRSQEALREAKEDAFTTVHALWRARATAYAANSEESRFLLDPAHAEQHQRSLVSHLDAVASPPSGLSPEQLLAAVRERRRIEGFSGYLADEVNHVTFRGDRDAAWNTLAAWQRYRAFAPQILQLERSGQPRKAIELCVGTKEGQAGSAFQEFDAALGEGLRLDQIAFEDALGRSESALAGLEVGAGLAAGLVAVLVFAGFAPRLREYR